MFGVEFMSYWRLGVQRSQYSSLGFNGLTLIHVHAAVLTWVRSLSKRDSGCIFLGHIILTHWGRVTHICVSNQTIIGSDNGLSPGRRQAIIWSNAVILLIRTLGTNFSEILSKIHTFSFKKIHFKMTSAKWRQVCLGLNVLTHGWIGPWWVVIP